MPTKEQLNENADVLREDVRRVREENAVLQERLQLATLGDNEAKAYEKVIQALRELVSSEPQRGRDDTYSTTGFSTTIGLSTPVARVLDAAAARFDVGIAFHHLVDVVDRLLAADTAQQELKEMKDRQSAIEAIMYPKRIYDPSKT